MEHAIMCPQCSAPLGPHPFARSVVCAYCGATVQLDETSISAARFHDSFLAWDSPASYGISSWISLGHSHWALEKCISHGDIADVYTGRRARWPTELVIIKLLRDRKAADLFQNEWETLQMLQRSEARGADAFTAWLPQPVLHGDLGPGLHASASASIFRWQSGFRHTLEDVLRAYPGGIPPRASIWLWRRILETLSFIHASGVIHGAVLPPHLLVQDNEHGVRLIGYSCAGRAGKKLPVLSRDFEAFYPRLPESVPTLSPQLDLVMSARCIVAVLGGDPATGSLPKAVPAPLAEIAQRIARSDPATASDGNAWAIREELGEIADRVFGPPQFIPIAMSS